MLLFDNVQKFANAFGENNILYFIMTYFTN